MKNTPSDLLLPSIFPKNKLRNVVLAEDDPEDVEIFQEVLSDVNATINLSVVTNGLLLIDFLHTTEELPDLIFLDMNMPLKNGLQCLQEIKKFDEWKNIRIIILSTSSQPELMKKAYELGIETYLEKPTSYSKFKMLIMDCLLIE